MEDCRGAAEGAAKDKESEGIFLKILRDSMLELRGSRELSCSQTLRGYSLVTFRRLMTFIQHLQPQVGQEERREESSR